MDFKIGDLLMLTNESMLGVIVDYRGEWITAYWLGLDPKDFRTGIYEYNVKTVDRLNLLEWRDKMASFRTRHGMKGVA